MLRSLPISLSRRGWNLAATKPFEILPNYIMFPRRRESLISQHALESVKKMRDILQSRLARRLSYHYRQKSTCDMRWDVEKHVTYRSVTIIAHFFDSPILLVVSPLLWVSHCNCRPTNKDSCEMRWMWQRSEHRDHFRRLCAVVVKGGLLFSIG